MISNMPEDEKSHYEKVMTVLQNKNFILPSFLLINFLLMVSLPLAISKINIQQHF